MLCEYTALAGSSTCGHLHVYACALIVICIISPTVASVEVRLQWSVWMFTVRWLLMRLSALTVVNWS